MNYAFVSCSSPAEIKIALFRSLFRGREDVYPRRFESRKTGKSGYSPACANEWVARSVRQARSPVRQVPEPPFPARDGRNHPPASDRPG